MSIYEINIQLNVIYYIYIFIACYFMNFFISKKISLSIENKKTGEEFKLKPWVQGLFYSAMAVGWPIIYFKLIKEDEDENFRK